MPLSGDAAFSVLIIPRDLTLIRAAPGDMASQPMTIVAFHNHTIHQSIMSYISHLYS